MQSNDVSFKASIKAVFPYLFYIFKSAPIIIKYLSIKILFNFAAKCSGGKLFSKSMGLLISTFLIYFTKSSNLS